MELTENKDPFLCRLGLHNWIIQDQCNRACLRCQIWQIKTKLWGWMKNWQAERSRGLPVAKVKRL